MLSFAPALAEHFGTFAAEVLEGGTLGERDLAVAILAAAYTMEDAEAVKRAIMAAKQVGLGNEEIGHVGAVVIAMRGQKIAALGQMSTPSGPASDSSSGCCR